MKIKKTTNYDMFHMMDANREVMKGQVRKIKSSILEKNLLEFNPIIVDKDNQVIDGQHRLTSAMELGLPVYYTQAEYVGIKDVRRLNSCQNNWKMVDWVQSWAKTITDYQFLYDFAKANMLPLSVSAQILTQFQAVGSSTSIKDGNFEIQDLQMSYKQMDNVILLMPFLSDVTRRDIAFNRAMFSLTHEQNVDWDRMIEKARLSAVKRENKQFILKLSNTSQYLRFFEDLYNFKTKKRTRLF